MPALTLDSTVTASRDQVSSDLAGETVLLSLTSAQYHGFTGVGARIWELIQQPTSVRAVCDRIVAEFDVTRERCEADVLAFLAQCHERGLIEVRSGA